MNLSAVPISVKLPAIIVALAFAVTLAISGSAYLQSNATVLDQISTRLNLLLSERASQLEAWSEELQRNIATYGTDPTIAAATMRMVRGFELLEQDPQTELQRLYIEENPFPLEHRDQMLRTRSTAPYHLQHPETHQFFRRLRNMNRFYDVFLFNTKGDMIYSVAKEDDFATNFLDGIYATSGLSTAYQNALAGSAGEVFTQDFAPYGPSEGSLAAFIATPVVDGAGRTIGVVAVQLPLDLLTDIVVNESGLGRTGDLHAISADGTSRTNSRFEDGANILDPLIDEATLQSLSEVNGNLFVGDVNMHGTEVVMAERSIDFLGLDWHLLAQMDVEEAFAPVTAIRNSMLVIGGIGLVVSGLLGWLTSSMVTTPLKRFGKSMDQVSSRVRNAQVLDTERGDEIGQLATALVSVRDKLDVSDAAKEAAKEQQIEQHDVVKRLSVGLQKLADGNLTSLIEAPFPGEYEQLREDYNSSVATLSTMIGQLASSAQTIRVRADGIADSSSQLSERTENQAATLEETAAALDQLTVSVSSAATSATDVEQIVKNAQRDAEASQPVVKDAVSAMNEIEKSSNEISQIINVINDISFQTNLLALNAGVEAARAGEAGRGFAVVASEVRALAHKSASAAKEIKDLIDSSAQQVERGAVLVVDAGGALERIGGQIGHISEVMTDLASGAAEQSSGLVEINLGVAQLDKVTQQNAAMVETTTANSSALNSEAQDLAQAVSKFTTETDPRSHQTPAFSNERSDLRGAITTQVHASPIQCQHKDEFPHAEQADSEPQSVKTKCKSGEADVQNKPHSLGQALTTQGALAIASSKEPDEGVWTDF